MVTGKTPFFAIGQFCTPHSIFLNIGFWQGSLLYGNVMVSALHLRYSSFLKKLFVFQKICFRVKLVKTLKISSDYQIKTCRSVKQKAILKIPIIVLLTLQRYLPKKVFSCVKAKTISNFAVKLAERSNHSFSVYLMNRIFQTSVFLSM